MYPQSPLDQPQFPPQPGMPMPQPPTSLGPNQMPQIPQVGPTAEMTAAAAGVSPEELDRQARVDMARLALREAHAAADVDGSQTAAQRLAEMNGHPIPPTPLGYENGQPVVPPTVGDPYAGTGVK